MKNKIFLDMDGTLARFNTRNVLNRYKNVVGFFYNLLPYKNIGAINELAKNGNVYIISVSPHLYADLDKRRWIYKYLPNIKSTQIVLYRLGENKAKAIKRQLGIKIDNTCYLLDDYTKNLNEWEELRRCGYKANYICGRQFNRQMERQNFNRLMST